MDQAVDQLQQLGFSQYEAQAYVALLRESPLNGYELAKASGIPRPNIYLILQKLEERGAVMRLEGLAGGRGLASGQTGEKEDLPREGALRENVRYAPVRPQELLARLKTRYQGTVEAAERSLSEISAPAAPESVLNMRGYAAMLDHARSLINAAQSYLLLSIWPEEAGELAAPLQQARERGLEITTLCLRGCPQPCPACQGSVFRYPIAPPGDRRWLAFVADEAELLAGEISPSHDALAVRTRQKMLVHLTAGYIQNSIALASILNQLGGRLDELLDAQTRAAFDALHPLQAQGRWIDVMRAMIQPQEHERSTHDEHD